MKGIAAYSKPSADGKGMTIDAEGMTVDLITVYKAGGYSLEQVIDRFRQMWPEVQVSVAIPKQSKN